MQQSRLLDQVGVFTVLSIFFGKTMLRIRTTILKMVQELLFFLQMCMDLYVAFLSIRTLLAGSTKNM